MKGIDIIRYHIETDEPVAATVLKEWIRELLDGLAKLNEDRDSWRRVSERLESEKAQAEHERDELKESLFYEKRAVEEWHGNAVRYLEERNALLEGLTWYADETNYEMVETRIDAFSTETTSATWQDSGLRARSIIAKIEGGELDMARDPRPYSEECDWCGEETRCYRVVKSDGMTGDICVSCLVGGNEPDEHS